MTIQDTIAAAKRHIETDPGLAVYMVRDLREVKAAELDSLAWALSDTRNYCHRNDAIGFFELLEKALAEAQPAAQK